MEDFSIEVRCHDAGHYHLDLTLDGDVLSQRVIYSGLARQALRYEANAQLRHVLAVDGYLPREILMQRVVDAVEKSCDD